METSVITIVILGKIRTSRLPNTKHYYLSSLHSLLDYECLLNTQPNSTTELPSEVSSDRIPAVSITCPAVITPGRTE
jgi:hypothetical protein